ncbi:hypothetical protein KHP60_04460 [Microvirga sp. 3-52]|uniref:hypothetical protein n=1 Tax=Microvirga sp. 3-52 TaxID=2792425 RepID=UPI001AC16BB7|nr:hypothetical protein [Microvirga sp. 3-52]MBO1903984.1 hypothetical protein [Microvirga sp. 3-52]MBS7451598.1 hypothetical protein [Microvirga sp. 3-52]
MARGKKKYDPKLPEVLRSPIEYTVMQLIAAVTEADDKGRNFVDEVAMEARQQILEQGRARYRALFEYYSLSPSDPDAKDMLILMMGRDLFPAGFRRTVKGRKPGVKETCWTVGARLELLDTVETLRDKGMKINAAAKYIADNNLLPSGVSANQHPDCIKTRYHEAQNMVERIVAKALTPAEELEFLAFSYGAKRPATDESESTD